VARTARLLILGTSAVGVTTAALLALVVFVVLIAAHVRPTTPSFAGSEPSGVALADIPARYLELYRSAGQRFGIDWAVLAGIGKVETDHGRSQLPGVRSGVNSYGCCAGPMQFSIVGPGGGTWGRYGVDGDGDGGRDVYDPADAIPGAANYLRASGAPGDYRRALFAYNHSAAYGVEVLRWADRYRAAAQLETGPTDGASVQVPFAGRWLARVPGTSVECDARIVRDVEYLLERFGLLASSCFSRSSVHEVTGEHPLGLALDAVPAGGDWGRTLAAARAFGWSPACAATGCEGVVRGPFRVILYNGYPGHGDPAHAGANAHIHFSWQHALAQPFTAAAWVEGLGH
jgi:hypothetical protein